jgi:hypothetical protein
VHFAVVVVAVVIIVIVVVSAFFFCIEERDMNVPGADTADAAALGESLGIVEKNLEKAEAKVKKFYELQFQISTLQEEVGGIYKECSKELKHVEKSLSAVESFGNAAAPIGLLRDRVSKMKRRSEDMKTIMPKTGSIFLRLMLGRVNVRVFTPNDRQLLRDEFTKFKTRTTYAYTLVPLLSLLVNQYGDFLVDTHWSLVLIQIWLMYYYMTLAIRQNVLKMNGSKMMDWWIYHHYISILMTAIYLTWPNAPIYNSYKKKYLLYLSFQGFVQFLQNRYQSARHYTLRALGRASSMDLPMTETITETPGAFLVLLIYVNQFVQFFLGTSLLYTLFTELDLFRPIAEYREEMQTLSVGILIIVLGIGNFIATTITLRKKGKQVKGKKQGANVGAASNDLKKQR